jgi:hypothetical protein
MRDAFVSIKQGLEEAILFSKGEINDSVPEDFAREANELFDAISDGSSVEPLVFNDKN